MRLLVVADSSARSPSVMTEEKLSTKMSSNNRKKTNNTYAWCSVVCASKVDATQSIRHCRCY